MPTFTPATLAQWTDGQWTTAPTAPLTGLAIDTRQLQRGDVFVALRTAKRDGHEFLAAAREAGAAAALVA
jgi:UDP-N-acetylmuramoyl-tripeptide--D-alanyl-D-alanine ligase